MTLIIEPVQEISKVNPYTKFGDHMLNSSAVRVLIHRYTDTVCVR